ncbi:exo-alpha-sialidase [Streptomyces viridochromogenes]|uniref:exo-alpha-sialidase n=1 Tax=Streptomyces viridochromogenes TaxID=1938 RepID=UPI00069EA8A0|nr:exo-alpha-sialidase [Streptomyces viridochromogenes]KOG21894.1 laminin G [Streptomyces viridochromogenes]KOG29832.1 laminin G [Streptomyces viridochromogenes]
MPSRVRARLRAALVAAVALTATAATSGPAESRPSTRTSPFEQQVLFRADQDPGYACFRIPAIVKSKDGTLLAFAEGRVLNCGDAADIDLVLKRSTDGGRTWGPLQVVNEGNGDTHGNPAPIVDRETGRILLAETYNTGRTDSGSCSVPCDRTPHLQYSDDDGLTWSEPRDLSAQILPADWNSWYATGPVHGIQLTKGKHAGRLVFGVNTETWDGSRVTDNHAALIVSDDGGDNWRVGATDSWAISAADSTFRQKPSEVTLTERTDGTIIISGREQDGTDLGHRSQTYSRDGGDSFTGPFRDLPDLYTPQVQGATLRLGNRLLLSAPGDPDRRRTMMIRTSWNGGTTWDSVDRGKVVTTDWSGYSDMVGIDASTVGLMYEGGAVDARDEIRFARFTEGWLGPRRGPDPTTPDLAPGAPRATVLGGARVTDGVMGKAMEFDGDDAVRLPYRSRLPLGTGEFTVSLFFRYSATAGEQPFLWMGGIGSTQPQVWLRGEPANDRVRALITTREGFGTVHTSSVWAGDAHNDDAWHHLALRRGGGKLTLFVDGRAISTTDVPGSVSRNSPFGVHVGQRMDSRAFLTGAIDDVRVWNRALGDSELDAAARAGARKSSATPDTVLWLPMDQVG